jgi:uncharacterized protein
MRVRSITCFLQVYPSAPDTKSIDAAGRLAKQAANALEAAGYEVQTIRLATQPLLRSDDDPTVWVDRLWDACARAGFNYLSLGPVVVNPWQASLAAIDHIPQVIRQLESVFAAILVDSLKYSHAFETFLRTARMMREIAHSTPQGFGNLRVAMLANVKPLCPFFPAAYHDGGSPAVALATESADLAVEAFADAREGDSPIFVPPLRVVAQKSGSPQERLTKAVQTNADRLTEVVQPLAEKQGYRFAGIDFSLAPFPEQSRSIGHAIEQLGVEYFGAPGTLFAASLLTHCLRQANYVRCGFNGLMLSVLEDSTLALRSREGRFAINDLLLYSAVCGTGLDTVPLPGDTTEEELAAIMLDVASLALRLDKPLTARLMPIPGAKAGDLTQFDFPFFANCRVFSVRRRIG